MDILEEVKDDFRQAKLHDFFKKYYRGIFTLLVLLLLGVSTCLFIRHNKISKQQELAQQYYVLFFSDKMQGPLTDGALGQLIKFRDSIFRSFAEFQYVNLAIKNKQYERAIPLLLNLIENKENPLELSNAAKIRLAELVMAHKMKTYYTKTADILTKAIKKPDAPYVHMMQLLLGQLLIEASRLEEGLAVLSKLNKDVQASEGVRFFCNAILSNYLE